LRSLCLTLTERCNLACTYCHARRSPRRMSPEGVDAAVDAWVAAARAEPALTLSFYGGEPCLEPALLHRAMARARAVAAPGQRLRCWTATNGLAVPTALLDLGLELAVSIDGVVGADERRTADGRSARDDLLAALPALLPHARLARVTVTPANVVRLCRNLQDLARLGFRRIVVQPAWELVWGDDAVAAWTREQERLATWVAGARASGSPVPELPHLAAVERRLRHGAPRFACGAGESHAAVATDGGLYPCYRFVFGAEYRLGEAGLGITDREAQRAIAVPVDALRPEEGGCAACPAADGCVHYCPALGHLLGGEPSAVPAVVCALHRATVMAVRRALC
jgi:uncharacterized protein